MSSFLFLLAVDVFSRMISKGVEGNIIELFKIDRNEVALSHLQFFDDTMLFCFGKEESFQILNHIVESFEDMSGLKINSSKCTIFYINFEHAKLQRWMEVFDREVGSFSSLYLRLPYGGNLRDVSFWYPICEKIRKRLAVWKKRFFSKASRLTLIRSISSGISMYYLSCLGPLAWCVRASKILERFSVGGGG